MTVLSLKKIKETSDDEIIIWGGLPSIAVLENSMSDCEFEAHLEGVLKHVGNGGHLIPSIADTISPDMKFVRLVLIAKLVREIGPVTI